MGPSIVDVNVLFALMHARHMHCRSAMAWLDRQDRVGSVGICRVAQMGALRLLTRSALMQEEVISPEQFWMGWDRMIRDDRLVWVAEPPGLEPVWREVTLALERGQCAETDTYLAAFANACEGTLVTFDRGFRRFSGLTLELLD